MAADACKEVQAMTKSQSSFEGQMPAFMLTTLIFIHPPKPTGHLWEASLIIIGNPHH